MPFRLLTLLLVVVVTSLACEPSIRFGETPRERIEFTEAPPGSWSSETMHAGPGSVDGVSIDVGTNGAMVVAYATTTGSWENRQVSLLGAVRNGLGNWNRTPFATSGGVNSGFTLGDVAFDGSGAACLGYTDWMGLSYHSSVYRACLTGSATLRETLIVWTDAGYQVDHAYSADGRRHVVVRAGSSVEYVLPSGARETVMAGSFKRTDLAIDAAGRPHVVVSGRPVIGGLPTSAREIWHGVRTTSGWSLTPVEQNDLWTPENETDDVSIAIAPDGSPSIAYRRLDADEVRVAVPGSGGTWIRTTIDRGTPGYKAGLWVGMRIGSSGRRHVAYSKGRKLYYAVGTASEWTIERAEYDFPQPGPYVYDVVASFAGGLFSFDIDEQERPHLAFVQPSQVIRLSRNATLEPQPTPTPDTSLLAVGDLQPGDLVVTEFMGEPGSHPDAEWIEIYNAAGRPVNLNGLGIANFSAATEPPAIIHTDVVVEAGAYAVIARGTPEAWTSTEVVPDAFWGYGLQLYDGYDEVYLRGVPWTVLLDWTALVYVLGHHSDQLRLSRLSASGNDLVANWCIAAGPYLDGYDYGSPGGPNDGCP